jgi:two-component system chemotaxis sensor kinase CheA
MVIRCGHERYIVPTLNIVESLKPTTDMLFCIAGKREHILVRGHSLPLIRLGLVLDLDDSEPDPTNGLVIIVESMHQQVAFLVDEVIMKHQVVIKTLGSELDVGQLFAGAAILSNGRVGLILNIDSLVETALIPGNSSIHAVA